TLRQGYANRPATGADFDAVVAVIQAADLADLGELDYTEEFLRHEWSFPQLELSTDTWLIERDGEVCAYAWLMARDEHRQMDGWGVVHPEHRGRGLGAELIDRVVTRARGHAALAPGTDEAVVRWGVIGPDTVAHELVER